MKTAPNSKANLDKAIQRFAGDPIRANEIRNLMANAIVAQMIGDGVVKGGTGLKFRYSEAMLEAIANWKALKLKLARMEELSRTIIFGTEPDTFRFKRPKKATLGLGRSPKNA